MIVSLKDKIDRLGPVNMMAIEQFDELEQRHAFLTVQRKDLVDSIAATGEAIRRIDETTKERFREAFNIINATFQRTFQTLFGGVSVGYSHRGEDRERHATLGGHENVYQPGEPPAGRDPHGVRAVHLTRIAHPSHREPGSPQNL